MDTIGIDINCDVGEGVGNEAALLPLISSCNIACGGHAGDEKTIRNVIRLAKGHGVKIGAHPSYPDKENFGRLSMEIPSNQFITSIQQQLSLFTSILKEEKAVLHHIKPHGALYNDIAKHKKLALVFLEAISSYKHIPLYVPFQSQIQTLALEQGFVVQVEAFADRNYNDDLTLVSRTKDNALLVNPNEVLAHLLQMVKNNQVRTVSGNAKPIHAQTFCVHGDTSTALEILTYLSKQLPNHQVQINK